MMSFRTFVLTIMGTCTLSMFSMQGNLDRIAQAAKTGDLATIQSLDPDGTNQAITTGDQLGITPLYMGAQYGQLSIVDYYVKKFEDLGKDDINPALTAGQDLGITPLYIAAEKGRLAIVEYYVKKLEGLGKDINPPVMAGPNMGWTPLFIAADNGRLFIVDYYVKKLEGLGKDDINPALTAGQEVGVTPLYIAAEQGRLAIVDYYVKKLESLGKDINPALTAGEEVGATPLCIAAEQGQLSIVDYYVKKFEDLGKDINPALTASEDLGITPLYLAAEQGQLAIVDYYVKKFEDLGKDINPALTAGEDLGITPLYIAAEKDRLAIVDSYVKKLESLGKNINPALIAGEDLGWTPLYIAADHGHLDIVKTLIYRGALLTAKNSAGQTAEDVARAKNQQDIANYLHTTAPLTQQLLKLCIRTKSLIAALAENYQKLLKTPQVATVQFLTESLETNRGQVKKSLHQIKKLIREGAEVNVQGKKGYSPLHCLIGYYNPEGPTQLDEEVRTLIDRGSVNLDAVADNGDTALSLAAQYGNSRIFKYLLQKGANPSIGKNPFLVAIQHNQMHIVRFLPGHKEQAAAYGSKGAVK